jgi:6-phosphogluconolactonase
MGRYRLRRFPDAAALADAAARRWLEYCARALASGRPCRVALCGGRSAALFFGAVGRLAAAGTDVPARLEYFWADERCVPPEDPESNYGLAHGLLLAPWAVPTAQVHRVQGELPPAAAAEKAAQELLTLAGRGREEPPALDWVLLGLGEDGHVASLFPGTTPGAEPVGTVYRAVCAPKPPPERVTLGYRTLAAARSVWVIASGPAKLEALRTTLAQMASRDGAQPASGGPNEVADPAAPGLTPLAWLLRERERTEIFAGF